MTVLQADAALIVSLYTDEGMLLLTGSGFAKGKQAIRFWQEAMTCILSRLNLKSMKGEHYRRPVNEEGFNKMYIINQFSL